MHVNVTMVLNGAILKGRLRGKADAFYLKAGIILLAK